MMERKPSREVRTKLFEQMKENARILNTRGFLVSAETMINKRTLPYLEAIHQEIVDMGCVRHEVHPMYALYGILHILKTSFFLCK